MKENEDGIRFRRKMLKRFFSDISGRNTVIATVWILDRFKC